MNKFFTLDPVFVRKCGIRFLITMFYVTVIAFFLYIPHVQELLVDDKKLYVYAFADMISPETAQEFEEQFGIKVGLKYFDSNEELLAKFKITRGKGYDVVIPTAYMIDLLRKEDLLLPLDHSKIPLREELDKRLMNLFCDPENKYSLPGGWAPYGIAYKKDIFSKDPKEISLSLIFEKPSLSVHPDLITDDYKIAVLEDSREMSCFAGFYLFGSKHAQDFTDERIAKIKAVLLEQKKWADCYFHQDLRYFFLADVIQVAITSNQYIRRIYETSDEVGFHIPTEGSIFTMEGFCISAESKKVEEAHAFINFMLSKKMSAANAEAFGYNPSNRLAYDLIDPKFSKNKHFFPSDDIFAKLHLLHNNTPRKKLEEMWLAVKSS
ncbi:spermidine/putrescine ABC transporter substrate-binding protein [Candidatus Babeliales bacterium]|nr:spermidine/putrescine ABC transporter substrate-binding protein [Candidatus Babeliales bacterium]